MPGLPLATVKALQVWASEFDSLAEGERFTATDFAQWVVLSTLPTPRRRRVLDGGVKGDARPAVASSIDWLALDPESGPLAMIG